MTRSRKDNTSPLLQRKVGTRSMELGRYLIVTDTQQTERNYLAGLKASLGELSSHIVISIVQTDTERLLDVCLRELNTDPNNRIGWIVFDRDNVNGFDDTVFRAEKHGIHVGWSNPCIEIWFYTYFGKMPIYTSSTQCCNAFKREFEHRTDREYDKADHDIYNILRRYGNEEQAIRIAAARNSQQQTGSSPSEQLSSTTLYKLVEEIIKKRK